MSGHNYACLLTAIFSAHANSIPVHGRPAILITTQWTGDCPFKSASIRCREHFEYWRSGGRIPSQQGAPAARHVATVSISRSPAGRVLQGRTLEHSGQRILANVELRLAPFQGVAKMTAVKTYPSLSFRSAWAPYFVYAQSGKCSAPCNTKPVIESASLVPYPLSRKALSES